MMPPAIESSRRSPPPRLTHALVATLVVGAWNYTILSIDGWKELHEMFIGWGLARGNALRLVNLAGNGLYYLGWLSTSTAFYLALRQPFMDLFPFRSVPLPRILSLLVVGVLVGPLGLVLSSLFAPLLGFPDLPPPEPRRFGMLGVRIGVLLTSALVTAFAEETLCRGVIYRAFQNAGGTAAAIVGSSLAFVLLHLDPARALYLLLPALLLGCARAWTGSLWPGLAIHAVHNVRSDLFLNAPEVLELF
jgi:membrane protease YdiL (CAAX protease family)